MAYIRFAKEEKELFKLLGGCGALSLAADLVLLDKQLHNCLLYTSPIADTSGDFKRLYDRNFAKNRPRSLR